MMGNLLGGGSSGGMNENLQKILQQKMIEEMFGIKQSEVPVWQAAEPAGQDRNGSWGILGVRLYRASITSPIPRLVLETNGPLTIQPEHVSMLAAFLQRNSKECVDVYGEELKRAKGMEGAEIFGAALGLDAANGKK